MAIIGGCRRAFKVGPVFRAETSRTHRHLCEFTGLDVEMEIMEHYFEVCDLIDGLFVSIFKHLTEKCKYELETLNSQYPFEPLKKSILGCFVVHCAFVWVLQLKLIMLTQILLIMLCSI
ncbi:unnamed protein product [Urochloa humidicola]